MRTSLRYNALRLAVLAVVLFIHLLLCIEVQAAKAVDVVITMTPGGLFAPTNFNAVVINDNKIRLSWTPNILATTTHIRAKVGGYPTGVADGYEVYNGAGATVDDNSVSLDETAADIYYIAYSVDAGGVHSPDFAQDFTGGDAVRLLALLGGACFMTAAAFVVAYLWQFGLIKWIAAGLWLIVGGYSYTQSTSTWDIYYLLFFFSVFVAVAIAAEFTYGEYQSRRMKTNVNINMDLEQFKNDYRTQRETFNSLRVNPLPSAPVVRRSKPYSTNDEERILKKSTNLFQQKLEAKYGKGQQIKRAR